MDLESKKRQLPNKKLIYQIIMYKIHKYAKADLLKNANEFENSEKTLSN